MDIPEVKLVVILDADRFGIAQLHQMRGRVRRSDYQSYCFIVSKSTVESSIKRLKLIEESNDGFALAEEDLLIRGAGDLFGEKQSGDITFKMADIVVDSDILNEANQCADELIQSEKLFNDEQYKELLQCAKINYDTKKEMLE